MKHLNAIYEDKKYVIEEDLPEVGAYLYIFYGEQCIYDFLQDSVKACVEFAFEEYGVPKDIWKSAS